MYNEHLYKSAHKSFMYLNTNLSESKLLQVPLLLKTQTTPQQGWIGIVLQSYWFVPLSNRKSDEKAAERAIDFILGWLVAHCTLALYMKL